MKSRVRPWQLFLALAALCAAAVGFVLWKRSRVDLSVAQMAALVRQPAATLVFVDVKAMRDSGVLRKLHRGTVDQEAEYRGFVAQTGFDYTTDLDQVVASLGEKENRFILRGRFDWSNLRAYAGQNNGQCWNGVCRLPASRRDRWISYYPIAGSIMAMAVSEDPLAAAALKPVKTQPPPVSSQPLWVAVPAAVLKDSTRLPSGTKLFAHALEKAESVLFTLGPSGTRLEIGMDATCKTVEDAAVLRAQLESVTDLLKKLIVREKQTPNASDLSGVLTAGKFERQDRHVIAKWPLDPELIDLLGGS